MFITEIIMALKIRRRKNDKPSFRLCKAIKMSSDKSVYKSLYSHLLHMPKSEMFVCCMCVCVVCVDWCLTQAQWIWVSRPSVTPVCPAPVKMTAHAPVILCTTTAALAPMDLRYSHFGSYNVCYTEVEPFVFNKVNNTCTNSFWKREDNKIVFLTLYMENLFTWRSDIHWRHQFNHCACL